MRRRIELLEKIMQLSKFAAVVIVDEGQPLPNNIGPGTVVIIDDVRKKRGGRWNRSNENRT